MVVDKTRFGSDTDGIVLTLGGWKSLGDSKAWARSLLGRMSKFSMHPAVAIAADIATISNAAAPTLTGRKIGVQAGQVTEVGSRGDWNAAFERLAVTGKSGLDFILEGQNVEITVFPANTGATPYWIWVNGAPMTAAPQTIATVNSTSISIKLAFPSSGRRRIEFFMQHSGAWQFITTDKTSAIAATPRKPVIAFVGDSFWDTNGASGPWDCADFTLSRMLGVEDFTQSAGGTGYTQGGTNAFGGSARVAAVAEAAPELIIFQGSVNDDGSAASVQAAATAAFAAYAAALPDTRLIVFGPPPSNAAATLSASRATSNAGVKAACAASPNVIAFHDMIGTAGGSVPAAAATFQTYPDGTLLSHLGSVWQVANGGVAYTNGPNLPNAVQHFVLLTYGFFGTGQVGSLANDGNRDVAVHSDGVHPTVAGSYMLAERQAAVITADLQALATLTGV